MRMSVYGVRQGWQGLVEGQSRRLDARNVGGMIQVSGTFLRQLDPRNFARRAADPKRFATLPNGASMV
jgi:6-phosphofructokinase 1